MKIKDRSYAIYWVICTASILAFVLARNIPYACAFVLLPVSILALLALIYNKSYPETKLILGFLAIFYPIFAALVYYWWTKHYPFTDFIQI